MPAVDSRPRTPYRRLLLPLLTLPEAETSHLLALRALGAASPLAPAVRRLAGTPDRRLEVTVFGLRFPNPIGLCAGFDKNGEAVPMLAALGFGHVEVGTVTPHPQPGKPRPRLFRLKEDEALINRLGFPSLGAEAVARNLAGLERRGFVLGANVGPNAGSVGVEGFVAAARALAPFVDYLTVNVSSPNTAGLRDMQGADALAGLLDGLRHVRKPLLVKIAPDLTDAQLGQMLEVMMERGAAGVIATNTTVARPAGLRSPLAREEGGLSGLPLRHRATEVVRFIVRETGGALPVVAAGGVASAADALEKLAAGACLVQLYTGFVYGGPLTARHINRGLLRAMGARGAAGLPELVAALRRG